jgi:hypothetical protein
VQVLQVPREMLERVKAVQPVDSAPRVRSVADFLPEGDPLAPLRARAGRRIGTGQVADLASGFTACGWPTTWSTAKT